MRAVIADALAERRDALCAEFERHGHDVECVDDASAALAGVDGADIVVLAWHDGIERTVREAAGDDRLVVVVGAEAELDAAAVLTAGAADVWAVEAGGGDTGVRVRLSLAEHYARLQAESVRLGGEFALLRQALDLTGTGFILTDPGLDDNPIVYANASFYELTGFGREEVLGHNCRFLQGPETEPERIDQLRAAVAAERPVTVELTNYHADGTPFRNEVHVAPVRDDRGRVVRFVGVQVDVSAYRRQETLFADEQAARRQAEAAERRSAFLAAASPLLDATLDLRATLESLARLTVPHLADLCLVDVLEADEVQRVAFAAAQPGLERLLRALPRAYPVGGDERDPVARIARTGRTEILRGEQAGAVFGGRPGALSGCLPHRAMLVPLKTRGRTMGVLALAMLDGGREFGDEEVTLAEDLARRAALAIDNARLFEQQSSVARILQESLLPDRLPQIDGIELAGAYRPAGDGTEVGGDFYDAFPAFGGGIALAIGDVTGKGAKAAALTGLTRHTLRTAAMYERHPSEILGTLNAALLSQRARRGKYCTVALARLQAENGHVAADVACAGHPLPLVLRASGEVETVGRPGTVLGFVADPRLHDAPAELHPGDALVLYTDGITEARTRTGLLGDERFAGLVRACAGLDAGAIAARLERAAIESQQGRPRDDVAIAVARVRG
jgi:PAS domain S-box-containing protein